MKNTNQIAEELGVTTDAIQKRLNPEFIKRFKNHMEEKDGCIYFDAEVEEFLRLLFNHHLEDARNRNQSANISEWYKETFNGLADVKTTMEEAALAKSPAQLPAMRFSQLPFVRAIKMPLMYQPEILKQAVDAQRSELYEFLNQFDRLVDYLAPDDWQRGQREPPGQVQRKPIRLVGTTGR